MTQTPPQPRKGHIYPLDIGPMILIALLFGFGLFGFGVSGLGAAESPADDAVPLIPLDLFLGNPSYSQARISPDGQWISYLAPSDDGVSNVWLRPREVDGEISPTMLTRDTHRGIRIHFWAENDRHLLFLQDIGGDENWHLYSADVSTGLVRDLTPFQGVRAQNVISDPKHPDEILVGLNLRDRSRFDMYRIDLETGGVVLDTENPGDVIGWVTDPEFMIRAAYAQSAEDGSKTLRVRDSVESAWRDVVQWPFGEDGAPIDFTADGRSLYALSTLGSNTRQLVRIDLSTGREAEVIASDPRADIDEALIHPIEHTVQATRVEYDRPEWTVHDRSIDEDVERLEKIASGALDVLSRDRADRLWIVSLTPDNGPVAYHLYDRESDRAQALFVSQPELADHTLPRREPVTIPTRDGLEMVSYLTLPLGESGRKLPMVLLVHGGPWARDRSGLDVTAQWLANRGYAVLQPNFRGSEGFGKSFKNAGDRQWGATMQNDLTDAVQWAVAQGIADPSKVAIFGGSYGGYAVLAGLTFTPDVYACGVDIVGPSNIRTLFESIPAYWAPLRRELVLRVGDVETDEAWNRKISPLFHVDQIRSPLLIGQGENDPRVNIRESDQIVEEMRKREIPVEYIVYPDEGHGFARPENRLDFFGRAEVFLADCLGGRSAGATTIEGTSADVR